MQSLDYLKPRGKLRSCPYLRTFMECRLLSLAHFVYPGSALVEEAGTHSQLAIPPQENTGLDR
jgi:hypothetical protein